MKINDMPVSRYDVMADSGMHPPLLGVLADNREVLVSHAGHTIKINADVVRSLAEVLLKAADKHNYK